MVQIGREKNKAALTILLDSHSRVLNLDNLIHTQHSTVTSMEMKSKFLRLPLGSELVSALSPILPKPQHPGSHRHLKVVMSESESSSSYLDHSQASVSSLGVQHHTGLSMAPDVLSLTQVYLDFLNLTPLLHCIL